MVYASYCLYNICNDIFCFVFVFQVSTTQTCKVEGIVNRFFLSFSSFQFSSLCDFVNFGTSIYGF